jgi:putative oxidoreductase
MLKQILFGGPGGGSRPADLGLLILRVYVGLTFVIAHGWPKLQKPSMIIDGVEKMGLPAPTVAGWLAILAEFGGGLLLALGLATRPAAFLIACTMAVAGLVAHANDPFQVKELAFTYLAIAITFMFTGSGRYGIDPMLRGRSGRAFSANSR